MASDNRYDPVEDAHRTNGYDSWSDRDKDRFYGRGEGRGENSDWRVAERKKQQSKAESAPNQAITERVETNFGKRSAISAAVHNTKTALAGRTLNGEQSGQLASTNRYFNGDYDSNGNLRGFSLEKKQQDQAIRDIALRDKADDLGRAVFGNTAGSLVKDSIATKAAQALGGLGLGGQLVGALGATAIANKAGDIANSFVGAKGRQGLSEAEQARYDAHRQNIDGLIDQEKSGWDYRLGRFVAGGIDTLASAVGLPTLGGISAVTDAAQTSNAFNNVLRRESSPQAQILAKNIAAQHIAAQNERTEFEKIHGRGSDKPLGILATMANTTLPQQSIDYGIPKLGNYWTNISIK